ncbi:PilZ domain-containing protein [Salaquimonas pukyongi]|uniref:PilZ domain-containing protein n=1 Tax=Salaquimonas pukyongi TaxID=2712698 RepID=UPI00096BAC1B|nr:PilZ domain-containing protein [Salaquimonas pukyongi]
MAPVTTPRSRGLSVDEYLKSFAERRNSSRTSVSREIVIQIDQQPMHTAILENISLGGAKFRMMYPTQLPKQFDIIGAGDNERPVPCEVVWQKHDRVGVKFLTA